MKRRKPLRRKSNMARKPLKRKNWDMKRAGIKPKPKKTGWIKGRYVATRPEWAEILRMKLGPCRVCGATLRPSLHHLVERDDFGDDLPENMIPLCGSGTTGCHGIYTSRMNGESLDGRRRNWDEVADGIRRTLFPQELAYVLEKKGEWYLEHRYPQLP